MTTINSPRVDVHSKSWRNTNQRGHSKTRHVLTPGICRWTHCTLPAALGESLYRARFACLPNMKSDRPHLPRRNQDKDCNPERDRKCTPARGLLTVANSAPQLKKFAGFSTKDGQMVRYAIESAGTLLFQSLLRNPRRVRYSVRIWRIASGRLRNFS